MKCRLWWNHRYPGEFLPKAKKKKKKKKKEVTENVQVVLEGFAG